MDSCWGIDDLAYAKEEAEAAVPDVPDTTLPDEDALDEIARLIHDGAVTDLRIVTAVKRTGRTLA